LSSDVLTDTIDFMKTQTTTTNPSEATAQEKQSTAQEKLSVPKMPEGIIVIAKSADRVEGLTQKSRDTLTANNLGLAAATPPSPDQMAAERKAFGEDIAGGGRRSFTPDMSVALRDLRFAKK
jgi:hypothetical protein